MLMLMGITGEQNNLKFWIQNLRKISVSIITFICSSVYLSFLLSFHLDAYLTISIILLCTHIYSSTFHTNIHSSTQPSLLSNPTRLTKAAIRGDQEKGFMHARDQSDLHRTTPQAATLTRPHQQAGCTQGPV